MKDQRISKNHLIIAGPTGHDNDADDGDADDDDLMKTWWCW